MAAPDIDQPVVLTIDVGGGSVRVALVNEAGKRLAMMADAAILGATTSGVPDLDTADLWRRVEKTVREAIASAPGAQVVAVTCTGIRNALIRVAGGEVIYASSNLDRRGVSISPGDRNDLGHRVAQSGGRWPGFLTWVTKVSVMQQREPDDARDAVLLGLADWLVYRLTGEATMSKSGASETGLLDVDSGTWNIDLADGLGISAELPTLVNETSIAGTLLGPVAAELRLPSGIPVINCSSDSHAALVGMDAARRGRIGIIAGTTSTCLLLSGVRPSDPNGRFGATRSIGGGSWVIESNPGMMGITLDWARRSLFPDLDPQEGFVRMEQAARSIRPGADGTFAYLGHMMIPAHLRGTRVEPAGLYWEDARMHVRAGNLAAEIARSTYESCAFATAYHLTQPLSTEPHPEIVLAGGLSQSRLLLEIIVDVLGRPIEIAAEEQSTLVGAALCAFHALGMTLPLTDHSPSTRARIEPSGQSYADAYSTWLSRYSIDNIAHDIRNGVTS